MKKPSLVIIGFLFFPSLLPAKPLVTREAAPLGLLTFESGLSVTQRNDAFGDPENKYETVTIPFYARLGIMNKLDFGISLKNLSHRLREGDAKWSGSATAVASPEVKLSILENISLLGIFTFKKSDDDSDALPVGRGNDVELVSCYSPATRWPFHLNLGYVWRGKYKTNFGVQGNEGSFYEPGDIFEAKTALEMPLRFNFSLTTELAYYYADTLQISGVPVSGSAGDALDALVGLNWDWKGWNIGVGAGFGLLDEEHSSIDLERGSGDVQFMFSTSYRLPPWWQKK